MLDAGTKWILTPYGGGEEKQIEIEEENGENFFMLNGKRFVYNSQTKRYEADDNSGEYYVFHLLGEKNGRKVGTYEHGWGLGSPEEGSLVQVIDPI